MTSASPLSRLPPGPLLVLGYGNPGRLDDGLGPAFCEALRLRLGGDAHRAGPHRMTIRDAFQLNVEDAAEVADHDCVVFVDATLPGPGTFSFEPVTPSTRRAEFTTHSATPAGIMGLARDLLGADTQGYALGIRGGEFGGFGERLSPVARCHLALALDHFTALLPRQEGRPTVCATPIRGEGVHHD